MRIIPYLRGLSRGRQIAIGAAILVVAVAATKLLARGPATADRAVVATVERGPFTVTVTTSGELRAKEFVQINAPANAMQAQAYQMRISSLVPEGTVVKPGDVVAEIDRSSLASRLTQVTLDLQKAQAQQEQAMLDSTLTLSTAREAIRNDELDLEAKRLAKEQAVYEAPTVQRQTQIDYERAERALAQAHSDLQTRTEQAQAKMREVGADVERQRSQLQIVQDVLAGFTIRAPSPGMVIYVKEWNGKKRTAGSQVNAWDPGVATLPDLTHMESVTYVNEIDVRRLAVGQPVTITLDADPTKKLSGTVASVANVGEQRPNTDAKVFEVHVTVLQSDTTLRPGMTTGNAVETLRLPDAVHVPLEAVNGDSGLTYAYRLSGARVVRQEIVTGPMNDHAAVVERGLAQGDRVLLSPPASPERLALVRLPAGAAPLPARTDSARARPAPARDATAPRR
ncbi:MAG TPA: efflux RND transporter periplasmic adaptor subunit [Gemmatimonadales bacterium]|nr:efflux RND transporter periplasmic adaptor subunit [Gemmatimonadales bacterium]